MSRVVDISGVRLLVGILTVAQQRVKTTLARSRGPLIAQPSADEVQADVRRLGSGLDHLILDLGGENYLQAAAGGRHGIPAGAFWAERREGVPMSAPSTGRSLAR